MCQDEALAISSFTDYTKSTYPATEEASLLRQQRTIISLIKHMSRIACAISKLISTTFEQDTASTTLRAAYHHCCEIHPPTMSITEFADVASHLFIYSCFVARYYHSESTTFQRQHITAILSYAHPLHCQCVEAIMSMESLANSIDEEVS